MQKTFKNKIIQSSPEKNTNILLIISNIGGKGGTEKMTCTLANILVQNNFSVSICSLIQYEKIHYTLNEQVLVHPLLEKKNGYIGKYFLFLSKAIRALIKKQQIDTVICVDTMLFLFLLYSRLTCTTKMIAWEHFNYNVHFDKRMRKISRKLTAFFADHLVVLTEKDKQIWMQYCLCRTQIKTINNPAPPFEKSNILAKPQKQQQFIAVGRLTHQKGFDLLLKIWKKTAKHIPNWQLTIIGDGEDKQTLLNDINKHQIPRITITPFTTKIHEIYQTASALLMTSRFEGLPMVLLEANAAGLPCIAYDCETGPAEIIGDKVSGFLIEENNEILFSQRLIEFANSPNLQKQMSQNALKNCERFSLAKISQQWIDLLNEKD